MTHPHVLHALIAAHHLAQARTRLSQAIDWEIRLQAQDRLALTASANIQAWRPTIGRASGGHADPTGDAIRSTTLAPVEPGHLRRFQAHVDRRLDWITHGLSLRKVTALLPRLGPAGAERLTGWLAGLDAEIRAELELGPAREELLAGAACPACSTRLLHAQALVPGRPVVCRWVGCRCAGEGCPCGMTAPVAGLVHVWAALPG